MHYPKISLIILFIICCFGCGPSRTEKQTMNDALKYGSMETNEVPKNVNLKYAGYDYVSEFYKEVAIVAKTTDGKKRYGLVDTITGTELAPLKYDVIWTFKDDLAKTELDKKYGLIDIKGKEIIPIRYDFIFDFENGLASVKLNNKFGYVDKKGTEAIPLQYDMAWTFSEGLAAVESGNRWGFINPSGKLVIPYKYDYVRGFENGKSEARIDGKTFYINKKGKCVKDCPE